jgi:hypothetical protein
MVHHHRASDTGAGADREDRRGGTLLDLVALIALAVSYFAMAALNACALDVPVMPPALCPKKLGVAFCP